MNSPRIIVPPPTPALRLEIAAFHLRERRFLAGLSAGILLLIAGIFALLCHVSTHAVARAVLFGVCAFCSGAVGIYAYDAQAAHRALCKNRREAGHV